MGKHLVVAIPGDGIGPEVMAAAQAVIEASGAEIEWQTHDVGLKSLQTHDTPLPEVVLEAIRNTRVALKGPVTTPVAGGFSSVSHALRRQLGLYANLRLAQSIPGCLVATATWTW